MEAKFYKCPICGNVFAVIEDSGVVPVCAKKMANSKSLSVQYPTP